MSIATRARLILPATAIAGICHISEERKIAAIAGRQLVGAQFERAVGPDIAAARHVDDAAGCEQNALRRIDER